MQPLSVTTPDPILRIIDANANRVGEAWRTLEDIARFALDDAELAGRCKQARHDLRGTLDLAGLDPARRLLARDAAGDVGAAITTPDESQRRGLRGVAIAAMGRLAEGSRSLAEALKALGMCAAAARAERGRYEGYEVGGAIVAGLPAACARQRSLCVLVSERLCSPLGWREVVRRAIDGGADQIQLREKELPDGELLARARELVGMAREHGVDERGFPRVSVCVNDRPDLALLAGADAAHLGQQDLPVGEARRIVGGRVSIGVSCATPEQARAAALAGADSLGLGPMFASTTKRRDVVPGVGLVRAVLADARPGALPHLCIGGITGQSAGEVWSAGARGVAVSSAVCGSDDPGAACRAILAGRSRGAYPRACR